MAIEDQIFQDLTPGMHLTIKGAAKRYGVSYHTAQRGLRKLWRQNFLKRKKIPTQRELIYEGRQDRLI